MATETVRLGDRPGAARIAAGGSVLEELLTARQVATLLQMRTSTIEDYARRGLLPSIKLGRHRRFVRCDIEQAIIALAEPAPGLRVRLEARR